jgi:SAM-dependent methyltransferase
VQSWSGAAAYEAFIGRWSRPVAEQFVRWLDLPPGARWLDVGCGTGALTSAVLAGAAPQDVTALDPSAPMVQHLASHVADPRVHALVADAQALPVRTGAVDAVVSGLVLNFVPDRGLALAEARRAARTGGLVAAYVWDYPGEMQLFRQFWAAAVAADPAAAASSEAHRFAVCRPEPLRDLLTGAGLQQAEVEPLVVPMSFHDVDDLWRPFLAGRAPAQAYVASLDDAGRERLRAALLGRLPVAEDGSILLSARAWAVRGRCP